MAKRVVRLKVLPSPAIHLRGKPVKLKLNPGNKLEFVIAIPQIITENPRGAWLCEGPWVELLPEFVDEITTSGYAGPTYACAHQVEIGD